LPQGRCLKTPALEPVYDNFAEVSINVEMKVERSGIEEALWQIVESDHDGNGWTMQQLPY
jgi:hypothetical protein